MKLVQVRPCDQSCCRESPRFPNADRTDCLMRDMEGCNLLTGYQSRDGTENLAVKTELVPDKGCIKWDDRTPEQIVKESCADWPQNIPLDKQRIGKTGDCCWQWVED